MKKIISFLSYNNAIPLVAIVLTMGAGFTFAASQGILPLPSLVPSAAASPHESVDASVLLVADLDAFNFHPTVTAVGETDTLYTVSYSIQTLAPEGNAWKPYAKVGNFSVGKSALGDGGLNAYVVGKLRDIENGERLYLSRAQAVEKALAVTPAHSTNLFSALVGLALDQIPVPIVEKPAAPDLSSSPQTPPVQSISIPTEAVDPAFAPGTSTQGATGIATATSTPVSELPIVTATTSGATSTIIQTETILPPGTATSTPESIASSTSTGQ